LSKQNSTAKGRGPTTGQRRSADKPEAKVDTRTQLLAATKTCLCEDGYARLSTRRVAELAGVPLSQIHYHFGSKQQLVLALLEDQNERLLQRQATMFAERMPLWQRWESACDYLDEDLSSGYVRVLQEMIAAGWSEPEIAAAVRRDLQGWYDLLTNLAGEAERGFGNLGPFTPAEVACLVGHAFIGSEALILLGLETPSIPAREALRKVAAVIRQMEDPSARSMVTYHKPPPPKFG
jgi:AcrR family transcriptional regulator